MIDSKENIKFDLGIKGLKTKSFAIQYQNGKLAYWMELVSLGRVVSHFKILV